MLKPTVLDALHDQIRCEFQAAYFYLATSAGFDVQSYPGFGSWMRSQAQEEVEHAMRLVRYVVERGGSVILKAIEEVSGDFGGRHEVFAAPLEHERAVTVRIHALFDLAGKEHDLATQIMLQWFIDEQVEEESTAEAIVERLARAGDDPSALLMLDHELGQRGAAG